MNAFDTKDLIERIDQELTNKLERLRHSIWKEIGETPLEIALENTKQLEILSVFCFSKDVRHDLFLEINKVIEQFNSDGAFIPLEPDPSKKQAVVDKLAPRTGEKIWN